jgi:V8-like Glu-specific endopeptidase
MQARAASPLQGGPQSYFRNLVAAAHLSKKYQAAIAGRFQGNAEADARALAEDAIAKKINGEDPRFTVVGSIVMALLKQDTSPDDARAMVAILCRYGLILDDSERERLAVRFMLPELATSGAGEKVEYGPEIQWLGPDELQLQSFLRPDPPWLDVGFLRKAMERSSAICRIELGTRTGTGFLVGPNLVLTNYHVLVFDSGDNLEENAKRVALRFGCFSAKTDSSDGQEFRLASEPIVDQSPVDEHDFLLLRVQDAIRGEEAIKPAPLEPSIPAEKSPLNIIHHPFGDTMKLSLSGNGVTGIYRDKGLLQYVTRAGEGSSGSPCFNDEWNVVGLHHAQRARSFGSIREGILVQAIYDRIKKHLDEQEGR